MFNNYIKNNYIVLISIFWIIIWASINTFPPNTETIKNAFLFDENYKDFIVNIVNILRFYLPVLVTNSLLIILVFFGKKLKIKNNLFLYIFFLFFVSQFIGLIFLDTSKVNLERTFLFILALNALGIMFVANNYLTYEKIKTIFFINLFFLILIVTIYLPIIYKDYFNSQLLYLYNSRTWNEVFIDDPIIRVTGLARVLALIMIILIVKINYVKSKKNLFLLFFPILLLSINIWGLQSRLVFLCIFVVLIFNLLFFVRKNFLKNLIFYALIIFLSIKGFEGIKNLKLFYLDVYNKQFHQEFVRDKNSRPNRVEKVLSLAKDLNINKKEMVYISSGRNLIWKKILEVYDYKKIFGYGPQADRYEILKNNEDKSTNNSGSMSNSSSAYFYSLICGGYVSLILILLINLYALITIKNYLKIRNYISESKFITDSLVLIIIYCFVRSIFENSYAVFSLDYLIFLSSAIILKKFLMEKNKSESY